MAIHIKKSHEGLLHRKLGVPAGEKIPMKKIEAAKNSPNPATRKQAVFAANARGWNHGGSKGGAFGSDEGHFKHRMSK